MDRKQTVGRSLKLARIKANLTQEQLAERADISSSYVSAIERGKQSVSLEYMDRLADALKISVSDLIDYGKRDEYVIGKNGMVTMREKNEYEGRYVARQKKMSHINEMLSGCGDKEFQIVYDEISLLMNKFQYLSDKGIK